MGEENRTSKNKRMNFIFTPDDISNLKLITEFLENKFGLSEDIGKTAAVRASLKHYADHLRKNDLH